MPSGRPGLVDKAVREANPLNETREVSSAPTPTGVRAPVTSASYTVNEQSSKKVD